MIKKRIHIAHSSLSGNIYAGHVLKDGNTWSVNKQDVTGIAIYAVCEHVLDKGGSMVLSMNDVPLYEIEVKRLG